MNFTVLISVYSVNPYKALDDGIAWNIIRALDQKFRLIVVTHPGNRKAIERFLSSSPDVLQAQFAYYAPKIWGPSARQTPLRTLLHKYSWHWGVVSFIREQGLQFDLAHHLSYPCGWCPSFLWRLGKPFIWGPAGYPPAVPGTFIAPYGKLARWKDRLCAGLKKSLWQFDPFVGLTNRKAAHIFAINQQVAAELKLDPNRTTILSSLTTHTSPKVTRSSHTFKILSIGPFIPLSGFDLAIRAFAAFYEQLHISARQNVELTLIGQGPARIRLEKIAAETKLPPGTIRIIESEDPELTEQHLAESKVFFSPTHENTNRLLPQALAHGLPVVCFDHREAEQLVGDCCGLTTPYGSYEETVRHFAGHLQNLFYDTDLLQELSAGARRKFERQLTWAARGDIFAEVYWNVFHRSALSTLTQRRAIDF